MTESEWLTCTDPTPMLKFIRDKTSERKLRLFAVACARRLQHLCPTDVQSKRLKVAERFADGASSVEELETSWAEGLNTRILGAAPVAWEAVEFAEAAAGDACARRASDAALWAMDDGQFAANTEAKTQLSGSLTEGMEHYPQAGLLRDIFGNPFSSPAFAPSLQTSTVLALATQMYSSRCFDLMPVLADALMDSGAPDDSELIRHCRGPGPHVRGCFVLDLILGRS